MINAKQAKNEIKSIEAKEEKEMRIRCAKERADFNRKKALARKSVLPSVLKLIEKEIKVAVKNKNTYLHFRFDSYWDEKREYCYDGKYLYDDVMKELKKNGFQVEYDSYTPTTGGDPDSGEGAEVCGPTKYSLNISWNDEKDDI